MYCRYYIVHSALGMEHASKSSIEIELPEMAIMKLGLRDHYYMNIVHNTLSNGTYALLWKPSDTT